MLYQWEVGGVSVAEVTRTFFADGPAAGQKVSEENQAFAGRLAKGVEATLAELDPLITEAAEHWRLERMNVVDRLILRLAVYEFLHETETPAKVIINEALELARTYGTDQAVRFINGILDGIKRRLERE
jgi:N utilization substance protein B